MIHLQKLYSSDVLSKMALSYSKGLYPAVVEITDKDSKILFVDDCMYYMYISPTDTSSKGFTTNDIFNRIFVTKTNETIGEFINKNAIDYTYNSVNLSKYFEKTPTGYYKVKNEYIQGNRPFMDFELYNGNPRLSTPLSTAIEYMHTNTVKTDTVLRQPTNFMSSLEGYYINCTSPNYIRPESDVITMFGIPVTGDPYKVLIYSAFRYFHPELLNCEYVSKEHKFLFVKFSFYANQVTMPFNSPLDYSWTAFNGLPDTVYTENTGTNKYYLENGFSDSAIVLFNFKKDVHYQVYADGNGNQPTQYEGDFDLTEYVKHFNDPTHLNFL